MINHWILGCSQHFQTDPNSRRILEVTPRCKREISPCLILEENYRTSASVKSYQLVKVVSGGRAPGKSSSLASPQLLVIERFHCFGAVRLEKVQFVYCVDF